MKLVLVCLLALSGCRPSEDAVCEKATDYYIRDNQPEVDNLQSLRRVVIAKCVAAAKMAKLTVSDEVYTRYLNCIDKSNNYEEAHTCDIIVSR